MSPPIFLVLSKLGGNGRFFKRGKRLWYGDYGVAIKYNYSNISLGLFRVYIIRHYSIYNFVIFLCGLSDDFSRYKYFININKINILN